MSLSHHNSRVLSKKGEINISYLVLGCLIEAECSENYSYCTSIDKIIFLKRSVYDDVNLKPYPCRNRFFRRPDKEI